jgi:RHS repeat-associated protein
VTTAYTYDTLNRLTQMGAGKNGTQQANYVYTLGAAGNRLNVAELSGRTVNYGYDSLYRLTSETITNDPNNHNNTTQYQYDNVGNRQQLIVNGTTANVYSYDADDRLGSDQYDSNGNTIASAGTTSTYDFENHLVSKSGVTIVYDGDGNRVSETVAGVTTQYLVDTQNPTGYAQVVDELQNGAVVRRYSWGLELISKLETGNSKLSFYGFDGHGSVRFLTDATGAVTDTYDYDAFGNLINQTGSTPNNYLFAGEQYDPAMALYYNRARYLNTATGRFWSMDNDDEDFFDPVSLHRYLYASGNPVRYGDPSGHFAEEPLITASEENSIGAEEDAAAIRIFNQVFRTTLYAGKELVYSTPTLLLRAAAALTALGIAASSVMQMMNSSSDQLPDAAAAQSTTEENAENSVTLFRDTSGTSASDFRWRGPEKEPDGLSFFETPFSNPQKPFSIGFKAKYVGKYVKGVFGGFVEPELIGIGVQFTPQFGHGHWSCFVTEENAETYAGRFAAAAKRIKKEATGFYTNPIQ